MKYKDGLYQVQAQVVTVRDGWRCSRQIPTFYLDSGVQAIQDESHAENIARSMFEGEVYASILFLERSEFAK